MATNRLWQSGAELRSPISEFDTLLEVSNPTISYSTTVYKTDSASYYIQGGTGDRAGSMQVDVDSYALQVGFHFQIATSFNTNSESHRIFSIVAGTTPLIYLLLGSDKQTLYGYSNGTLIGLSSVNLDTWYHIGVSAFIDPTNGWGAWYIDGTEIGSQSGVDTGSSKPTGVNFGTVPKLGSSKGGFIYYDDMFIDDITGETLPKPVPDNRFYYKALNGDGDHLEFSTYTGSTHYTLLDEVPPVSTDYVYSTTPGQRDFFNFSDYTLSPGSTIESLIPIASGIKSNAADILLGMGCILSGTYSYGSFQSLPTSVGKAVFARFSTNPFGNDWTENDINNSQIGMMSSGTYS